MSSGQNGCVTESPPNPSRQASALAIAVSRRIRNGSSRQSRITTAEPIVTPMTT
jgi:hypothetical protein